MGLLQRCSLDWATNMPLNTLFFWALKLHGSTHLLSKGTEQYFLSNSGNAKIIIGLRFVSRDNFCLGTAFGWIITSLADLNSDICGAQTESNFGKTVLHFVTRDSSSLGVWLNLWWPNRVKFWQNCAVVWFDSFAWWPNWVKRPKSQFAFCALR